MTPTMTTSPPPTLTTPEIDTVDIELEDVLPNDANEDQDSVFQKPKMWLDVNGKSIHKSSAVRFLLSSESGIKSTDRLRRVRGYSRDPATATLEDDSLIGDNFLVGQVVASFLCINNLAALALIHVTIITNPSGMSLPSINNDGMNNPAVKLSGQILQLKAVQDTWQWTGDWEIFKKPSTSQLDTASKNSTVVVFPANLVIPISPQLVPHSTGVCWQFDNEGLGFIASALWEKIKADPSHIPTKPQTTTFPYRDASGNSSLISDAGSKVLSTTLKEGDIGCFICGKITQQNKICDHVAGHILAMFYSCPEKKFVAPVGLDNTCGSCGRSGTCTIGIIKKNGTEAPHSNCPNYYKFSMKTAAKSTKTGPSTNRPVICYLCQEHDGNTKSLPEYIFWSYNLAQHLEKDHHGKTFRDSFLKEILVTKEERARLSIELDIGKKRKGDTEVGKDGKRQKKST